MGRAVPLLTVSTPMLAVAVVETTQLGNVLSEAIDDHHGRQELAAHIEVRNCDLTEYCVGAYTQIYLIMSCFQS